MQFDSPVNPPPPPPPPGDAHVEFCCHLARGNIDPKEPPVYEYVKFVGDFKFHNNGKYPVYSTCAPDLLYNHWINHCIIISNVFIQDNTFKYHSAKQLLESCAQSALLIYFQNCFCRG